MPEQDEEPKSDVTRLIESIESAVDVANKALEKVELNESIQNKLGKSQGKIRNFGIGVIIGLVLDLALSVAFLLGLDGLHDTNDKLNEVQCSLYNILLQPPDPSQINTPEKKQRYEDAVAVIHQDYLTLGCKGD